MNTRIARTAVCLFILAAAVTPAFAAAKKKKKPAPKPQPEVVVPETKYANQIDFVAQVGTSMNNAVLMSLDVKLSRDVRPDLIALRDNLLDEAKAKPAASPDTYKVAVRLTDAWLSALQERETRRASLGLTPPPTTDMDHGKKTSLHFWDDILTFQREMNDAKEKKATDKQKRAYFRDADINNWRLRTEVLRPNLESLYSQFRELRRQSL